MHHDDSPSMAQDVLYGGKNGIWRRFSGCREVVTAYDAADVIPALMRIEDAVTRDEVYAAGFIGYEAAPAFDPVFRVREPGTAPLVWFGLFGRMEQVMLPTDDFAPYRLGDWTPTVSREEYHEAIARIKGYIARGETYQVNYTYRLRAPFDGDPYNLFRTFVSRQPTAYGAYIDTGGQVICSASPELFFRLEGGNVTLRPMKGTIRRGCTTAEDRAQAQWLHVSAKDRAENTMIVDMTRNDIGRVAIPGSVRVPDLFSVERYPTLWQMTSTVTAETGASFTDIMGALFPGASITGAPKARTTGIIAELETTPRQVYTGAVGYLAPERIAEFNIAIRTMLIDRSLGIAEYGTGGGIVWDSTDTGEYAESRIKARVLDNPPAPVSLLETMRRTPDEGFYLLGYHLARLRDSAAYFGYPYNEAQIFAALDTCVSSGEEPLRVRLLLAPDGEVSIEHVPLDLCVPERPVRLRLAQQPVCSDNPLLYHKTSARTVYEQARRETPDCDDVILHNERGEVTESTIANIVVRLDGELVTPPVTSGLLAGTFRARLLDDGAITERVVTVTDLARCEAVYLVNSVRGWREATLTEPVVPIPAIQ